jgi:tetratricopeptide (TPR) repeat protein
VKKPERKKIIIFIAAVVFICLVILQIILSVRAGKGIKVKPDISIGDKDNINLESELKKIEILIKMGFENADIYFNRGWIYAQKGQYALAKKDYSHALQLDKHYTDAYYNRGLIYLKEKEYADAISDFTEAIKSAPEMSDAICNRGNAYLQTGKVEKALEDYTKAISLDGKDPDLYYNRAFIYRALGRFKDADMDIKMAEALNPKTDNKKISKKTQRI